MISLEDWKNKQTIMEFTNSISPNVGDSSQIGQPQQNPNDELPNQLASFMRILKNKPYSQIIDIRNKFNSIVQQMLMDKGRNAGRMGMINNFNQAREIKTNFRNASASNV
mgnify:CR=1 FL=1